MSHRNRAEGQGARPWPCDTKLLWLMRSLRSYTEIARACGKSREALRDYLRLRPGLATQLRAYRDGVPDASLERILIARMTQRRADRAQMYRERSNPETTQYENILRKDPCSYLCGYDSTCTDHIVPRAKGGLDHWSNFTGACGKCNGAKSSKSLLEFLLDQLD